MRSRHPRRLLCWLGLALLASACGSRPITPAPPGPRPVASLGEADIRSAARLLQMEDTRTLDTLLIAGLLGSDSPELRARAALAAGRVRQRAATPFLLRATTDPNAWVRANAAFALGQSGDSSANVTATLGQMALRDATGPAIEAIAALTRVAAPAARPFIDSLLAQPRHHAALRNEAATVAWRLPRDSATIALLTVLTRHQDPETRWRALYSLARNGSPAGVPAFLERVADDDHRVRANAVRGLRAAHADSAGLSSSALAALLDATTDPHPHVRINALRLLPGYRQSDRTRPVLISLLRDPDANTAIAATQALAEAGDRRAVSPLRSLAADASLPAGMRTAALAALNRLDPAAAISVATDWLDASEWVLRQHASRAFAAAPWSGSAAPLQQLARDPHYLVAAEALQAIRAVADSLPETRRIYIEALNAEHVLVRAAALRGLARLASAADLDLLLQAYGMAREDATREAAMAALEGLQRIASTGTPVGRAFFLRFGEAGPPRDAVLYRAIVQRIGTPPSGWRPPDAAAAARPIEFYDEVVRTLVAPVLAGAPAPRVAIGTQHGEIVLHLASADAPLTVHNFLSLIESGYYEGTRWHRVVPNFVIQDGDPRGSGSGGPGYAIRDEINPLRYLRGTLGMALSGPDTGGSQYFITHSPQPHLDGGYTVFGQVVDGMDAVDDVVQEEEILYIRVVR